MKLFLVICLFFLTLTSLAQSDYHMLVDQCDSEHGEWSYDNLDDRIHFLDSLSNVDLSSGKEKFLMDLGTAYGWKQVASMDDSDQMKSLEAFKQCWDEFENQDALFQVLSIYMFVDCTMSLFYCNVMEEIIANGELKKAENKRSYEEQMARIRQYCAMQ